MMATSRDIVMHISRLCLRDILVALLHMILELVDLPRKFATSLDELKNSNMLHLLFHRLLRPPKEQITMH